MAYNWIVINPNTAVMRCERCGQTFKASAPISFRVWDYASRMFIEQHKDCKSSEVL